MDDPDDHPNEFQYKIRINSRCESFVSSSGSNPDDFESGKSADWRIDGSTNRNTNHESGK
ncbi:22699_t:CDS:2 [Rhizophagus irregularis]|nr:22699_t:CDS:2 [Rhizophagus irregularis]